MNIRVIARCFFTSDLLGASLVPLRLGGYRLLLALLASLAVHQIDLAVLLRRPPATSTAPATFHAETHTDVGDRSSVKSRIGKLWLLANLHAVASGMLSAVEGLVREFEDRRGD